jgi:hypothetical protein
VYWSNGTRVVVPICAWLLVRSHEDSDQPAYRSHKIGIPAASGYLAAVGRVKRTRQSNSANTLTFACTTLSNKHRFAIVQPGQSWPRIKLWTPSDRIWFSLNPIAIKINWEMDKSKSRATVQYYCRYIPQQPGRIQIQSKNTNNAAACQLSAEESNQILKQVGR